MACLFYDGHRLVTEHLMFWVERGGSEWLILSTEGRAEYFSTKQEALDRLQSYATEEQS